LQRDTRQSEIYINPILDGIKRTLSQRWIKDELDLKQKPVIHKPQQQSVQAHVAQASGGINIGGTRQMGGG
jgi:hypothetical protein